MIRGVQLRMARAALGWSLKDLANKADVHVNTIARCEAGFDALMGTMQRIEDVFRNEGVVFIEDGLGFGVTVLHRKQQERRPITPQIRKTKPKKPRNSNH